MPLAVQSSDPEVIPAGELAQAGRQRCRRFAVCLALWIHCAAVSHLCLHPVAGRRAWYLACWQASGWASASGRAGWWMCTRTGKSEWAAGRAQRTTSAPPAHLLPAFCPIAAAALSCPCCSICTQRYQLAVAFLQQQWAGTAARRVRVHCTRADGVQ